MHATGEVHAPAVLGQAAIFAHLIEECRERMHTGKLESEKQNILLFEI